jgi:hypothetical protein
VPNYRMAAPGHSFVEGPVNLSWGIGRASSDVINLPYAEQSGRFKERVLAGVIVETKDRVTTAPDPDVREYRLMTGDEARAHKAIPAGPVTRSVYNPVTGEMSEVEIKAPRELKAAISAEEAAARPHTEAPSEEAADAAPEPADPADAPLEAAE